MARTRQRRQRGTNYTGILRSGSLPTPEPVSQTRTRGLSFSWRWVSGVMVICLSLVLALFFVSDALYVSRIAVGGLRYMTQQEVYSYAAIDDLHIFWVEPEAVKTNLLDFPTVADAQIRIGWPPNMVNIIIEEREPVLVWEQGEKRAWVDINGSVMPQRTERDDLLRIVAEGNVPDEFIDTDTLDPAIVYGAVQLSDLRPEVTVWRYDFVNGLGFQDVSGRDIWFGDGTGMPEKWGIYATIAANVETRGLVVDEINIVDPDGPYYTLQFEQ